MDSKIKKTAVFTVICMLAMVLGAVAYVNRDELEKRFRKAPQPAAEVETAVPENTMMNPKTGQIGNDLTAWMRDETFFNSQSNLDKYLAYSEAENKLSLIVTSVEQDLRIYVVDGRGNLVEGESFYVTVRDVGEYKDLDQDGIIYIADMKPGEYYVSLNKISGYRVADNETKVRVKDMVEYIPINDISLLIKTEEEIDALAEDTAFNEAAQDADNTEVSRVRSEGKFGIDVSKWNKEIDWDKVKQAGVEYAIIRCGYRGSSTGALVEDPYFEQNIRGAAAAGIPVGVYFFTQAVNEVEAIEEASMVISLCSGFDLQYPVFIDTEGAGGNGRADGLDVETRTKVCEAFGNTVRNAGYNPGVYASRNWYNEKLEAGRLEGSHVIWLAEYRKDPLYQGEYQMWQYSSKGSIDGIEGRVDMNISYLESE